MAYDTICFDIDGTLCDPGDSIIESARYALHELGIEESDKQALRRFVGPPLEYSFKDYYGFDDATTERAVQLFRTKLVAEGIDLYRPYEGIPELLGELHQAGRHLVVVTSKIQNIAERALEATGLARFFNIVCAQQPNEVVKKELVLARALQKARVSDGSSVVMVGDRMHDIEAANAHGIDSIGVLYGYGTQAELLAEGATYLAKDPSDLRNLLS